MDKTHEQEDISLSSNTQYNLLDNGALNGLLGLFAFHVMLHHSWANSPQPPGYATHLYGDVVMPLYFMLCGFNVTLAYGKIRWNNTTVNRMGHHTSSSGGAEPLPFPRRERRTFPTLSFYRKRFIKIFPVHVLGIVLSLILWNFR